MNETGCQEAGREALIDAYAAGRLDEERARAFEDHFVTCEACWAAIERGLAVRAAFARGPIVPRHAPRPWLGGALIAASLAVIVAAAVYRPWAPAPPPVYRGAGALKVTARMADGQVALAWEPVKGAASYAVEVTAGDGTPRVREEGAQTRVTFPRQRLEPRAGGAWRVRVQALDALGNVVAESDGVRLEEGDGR